MTPFVPELVKNPDGTAPVEMHPWIFMGSLESGTGDCAPSTAFSFGSVKDLGLYGSQPTQPPCEYKTEQVDEDDMSMALWDATCALAFPVAATGVRLLGIVIEPHRAESGEWVHVTQYVKSVRTASKEQNCIYRGLVRRREPKE